jgi:hypothetical protein
MDFLAADRQKNRRDTQIVRMSGLEEHEEVN